MDTLHALLAGWLDSRLEAVGGETGVYIENLATGEVFSSGEDTPVVAASVIKLPVMIELFRQARAGLLSLDERHALRDGERLPSCGTLKAMHTGIEMTLLDLCQLMIIVSDNAATNILIRRVGMESVNRTLRALDCEQTTLRRLLFDSEASARGIENTITAGEMGRLLRGLHLGEIVSPQDSRAMLHILLDQRLNGKLPFFLHTRGIPVAHKTGEDDGITHDVGILYAREPVIACFVGEHVDVPAYERLMQDAALRLCAES